MRDPAMHIRLSDFVGILTSIGIKRPEETAERIFRQAVPLNIKDRHQVTGNAKTQRQLKKVIVAANTGTMTVERFNLILDSRRRAAGHRHLSPIRKNTTAWAMLRDVAVQAVEFSESVGMGVDEGSKLYIDVGLELMKKNYGLNKFKYYEDKIYKLYESYDLITTDPQPERTKEFHDVYCDLLMEYASISRDLSKAQDYVQFLLAAEEAEHVGADAEDWIRAQFEILGKAFDAIPNPSQLFGDWSVKRFYEYFQTPKAQQEEVVIISRQTTKDDFTAKYEAKVRELANKISEK